MPNCNLCNQERSDADFWPSEISQTKRAPRCSQCMATARRRNIDSPESYLRRTFSQLKSQRTKSDFTWDITVEDVLALWDAQDGLCAISGLPMTWLKTGRRNPTNASIDRIHPDIGYRPDNVQLTALQANLIKGSLDAAELCFWISSINRNYGGRNA